MSLLHKNRSFSLNINIIFIIVSNLFYGHKFIPWGKRLTFFLVLGAKICNLKSFFSKTVSLLQENRSFSWTSNIIFIMVCNRFGGNNFILWCKRFTFFHLSATCPLVQIYTCYIQEIWLYTTCFLVWLCPWMMYVYFLCIVCILKINWDDLASLWWVEGCRTPLRGDTWTPPRPVIIFGVH